MPTVYGKLPASLSALIGLLLLGILNSQLIAQVEFDNTPVYKYLEIHSRSSLILRSEARTSRRMSVRLDRFTRLVEVERLTSDSAVVRKTENLRETIRRKLLEDGVSEQEARDTLTLYSEYDWIFLDRTSEGDHDSTPQYVLGNWFSGTLRGISGDTLLLGIVPSAEPLVRGLATDINRFGIKANVRGPSGMLRTGISPVILEGKSLALVMPSLAESTAKRASGSGEPRLTVNWEASAPDVITSDGGTSYLTNNPSDRRSQRGPGDPSRDELNGDTGSLAGFLQSQGLETVLLVVLSGGAVLLGILLWLTRQKQIQAEKRCNHLENRILALDAAEGRAGTADHGRRSQRYRVDTVLRRLEPKAEDVQKLTKRIDLLETETEEIREEIRALRESDNALGERVQTLENSEKSEIVFRKSLERLEDLSSMGLDRISNQLVQLVQATRAHRRQETPADLDETTDGSLRPLAQESEGGGSAGTGDPDREAGEVPPEGDQENGTSAEIPGPRAAHSEDPITEALQVKREYLSRLEELKDDASSEWRERATRAITKVEKLRSEFHADAELECAKEIARIWDPRNPQESRKVFKRLLRDEWAIVEEEQYLQVVEAVELDDWDRMKANETLRSLKASQPRTLILEPTLKHKAKSNQVHRGKAVLTESLNGIAP